MRPTLVQPISIKLMPSKLILGSIVSVSITACVILLYLPISVGIKLAIIALILASSTYYILRDALLRLSWSWQALEVNSKGQLKIVNQRGTQFQPVLAAASFVHPNLTDAGHPRPPITGCGVRHIVLHPGSASNSLNPPVRRCEVVDSGCYSPQEGRGQASSTAPASWRTVGTRACTRASATPSSSSPRAGSVRSCTSISNA